jgi:hypothetical protein
MSGITREYIEKMPKLGFGIMRLPTLADKAIDMPKFIEMVDYYMANGMNYFDTAIMYHGGNSEGAVRTAVVERYPRESFMLATKLPMWDCEAPEDMGRIFNGQLERMGVDFFDFYLIHGMNQERDDQLIKFDGYAFLNEMKASGKIKNLGFSFHGKADNLDKVLRERPEIDFVMLQINYYDWHDGAKEFYEITRGYGKPILIMEPVRGGSLANLPKNAALLLEEADPEATQASWALRYCGSLDGVICTLSGMSNMRQIKENVELFKDFRPLKPSDCDMLYKAADELRKYPKVNCTTCRYCECPIEIPIAEIFKQYNRFAQRKNANAFKSTYAKFEKNGDMCVDCGKCTAICPQGLDVVDKLKYISRIYNEI